MPIAKSLAPVTGFGERVLLDHGAHRAVKNNDALPEKPFQFIHPANRLITHTIHEVIIKRDRNVATLKSIYLDM